MVFDCPASTEVHRYLARMNFYADLPPHVVLSREVPPLRRRDRRTKLFELVRIRTPVDVEQLMERVHQVADAHLGTGLAAAACATALGEVTANVLDHAGTPEGALVAAQRYKTTGLELAVVDLGAGIPTTLARNAAHRGLSDIDALQRSLKDGVSGIDEPGRGSGLADLVKAVGRAGTRQYSPQAFGKDPNLPQVAGRSVVSWFWRNDPELYVALSILRRDLQDPAQGSSSSDCPWPPGSRFARGTRSGAVRGLAGAASLTGRRPRPRGIGGTPPQGTPANVRPRV